jgi:hypothetical protein
VIPCVKSILDITFSEKIWQQGMVMNGRAFLFILYLTFLPVIIDHAILPYLNICRCTPQLRLSPKYPDLYLSWKSPIFPFEKG